MDEQPTEIPLANPTSRWIRRYYGGITAGIAGLLLFLAVLAPFITPVTQRGTVAIITVLFGFVGALMLYSALSTQPRTQTDARTWIGLGLGVLLTIAGLAAPFALSAGVPDADTSFLLVLGYAPVALSGGLIAFICWRKMRNSSSTPQIQRSRPEADSMQASFARVAAVSGIALLLCAIVFLSGGLAQVDMTATAIGLGGVGGVLILAGIVITRRQRAPAHNGATTRRAPVPRVPGGILYRVVLPIIIVLILLLIVAVIGVVVAGTLTPLLR